MYTAGCDYNQLVYDFIYQYYDVAGDTMYEYYNYLISYYAYLQGKGMGGTITEDISVAKNWSVPVLKKDHRLHRKVAGRDQSSGTEGSRALPDAVRPPDA